jgi:RHS repeat-associated protein
LADALQSSIALTDGSGAVQTSYTYEPFGGLSVSGAGTTNTIGYTGREADGTGLFFYRSRYYDPRLQRFLTEDPLEFAAGDTNLFAYVTNSPINFKDPTGEFVVLAVPVVITQSGAIAAGTAAAASVVTIYLGHKVAPHIADVFESIGDIISDLGRQFAQRGKRNVRDSRFENKTDAEVQAGARDRSLPPEERRKYQKEEKARRLRNQQRRGGGGEGGGGGGGGVGAGIPFLPSLGGRGCN